MNGADEVVDSYMNRDFRSARLNDQPRDVARTMAEFNLLALPVLTDHGDVAGLVTVDDAMELLLPGDLKRRLPTLFQ